MYFFKLLLFTIGFSISQISVGQTNLKKAANYQQKSKQVAFSINHFKAPKEIVGCNCTFSESKEKFDRNEFIFAAKNNSIGFISIDGKLVKLKLVSTGDTFGPEDHKNIYSNGTYKVVVDTKFKKTTSEEVWWNEGTITVHGTSGEPLTKKFVGNCGC